MGLSPIEKNKRWPKSLAMAECGANLTFPPRESKLQWKSQRKGYIKQIIYYYKTKNGTKLAFKVVIITPNFKYLFL